MARIFGTDGVRGVANRELTAELAFKLGRAGAYVLTKEKKGNPKIVVATDTRVSCDMLEAALVAGICSVGATAVTVGIMPSPAVSALIIKMGYDAGVVISASHNPFPDNGIKFFDSKGCKLSDQVEDEIEKELSNNNLPLPIASQIGRREEFDAVDEYVEFLKSATDEKFEDLTVCLDCANGASYKVAPITFFELGCQLKVINNEPDGYNINLNCGSMHPEGIVNFVKESGADVGFAFDGDADRVLAVDETGCVVDGDQILAICGNYLKSQNQLNNNTIVATVMSNMGLTLMGNSNGINIVNTSVGDRYVLENMLANGHNLGGEQSGHIIFLDNSNTGDGELTAIKLLTVMKKTGKKLSELKNIMPLLPQVLKNVRVPNEKKYSYMDCAPIRDKIMELEEKFKDKGRVMIRTSGTEPLIRILIEGQNIEEMRNDADSLAKIIEQILD